LFDYFNRGVRRTYLYELIDQGSDDDRESRFGLIRENGTPKLAFTAVRNTIALLKDPGPSFIPNALNYTIQSPSSVKRTILQKRDGRFYMVLWNDVVSYNAPRKQDVEPIWQEVTLTFPDVYATVNLYRPIESTKPLKNYSNVKTLKVLVPDFPVVLELES
jgi:predicted TIM-barrel fold metal-dependent hydrolase